MRKRIFFRLVAPVGARLAGQLARPHGWFGRVVMTRALNRGNRELIAATLDQIELTAETRLLDIGFGGGLSLEFAARRGVRHLSGVDPSEAAVSSLRARPRWLDGAELRIERGAVEALPFGDAEFDAVLSTNTIYFWPDLGRALSEIARVLRPGGRLALGFSSNDKLKSFPAITQHGFIFHSAGELGDAAERSGFVNVRLVELHGADTEGSYVLVATMGRPSERAQSEPLNV
jgi:arsenite methyltransferase